MAERVLVLGGGFAGNAAARALGGQGLDVTLIDQCNYHLFQPLLYQVAAGDLQAEAIATPLRRHLHGNDRHFRLGRVSELQLSARQVLLADGEIIPYDYLFIALGTVTNFFGNAAIAEHALQLKGMEAAEEVRSHIFSALEAASHCTDPTERRRWLSFVIAGGGPTGVEFCGALAELLRVLLPRDYPELHPEELQITLVQGGAALLPGFAAPLQAQAARKLQKLGAQLRFHTHVQGFDGQTVQCRPDPVIPARTLVWTAGVTANPLMATLPGTRGPGGRIIVDPHLRLPGHPEVFILGDLACSSHGEAWPQVAPFALQSARYAALVLQSRRAGRTLPPPFAYRDPGSMAVLGRFDAVCQIERWHLQWHGWSAWLLWLGLHLYRIIGTRNRLLTLLDWGTDYLRHGAAVEIIRLPPKPPDPSAPSPQSGQGIQPDNLTNSAS
ncbi:NAD(P)/FAD-dependent oxidoreductase [Acidithiobacillus sp. CV18-2]|nr:NAD(P)/FAD-dependent oxidoreductase [Acidithiobacillus sp. CV18-3]MBU2756901.1 NAD(P)/FAD-dependent oxidoreductase [Acidithiobacillus sp. BN09-2]MBU2778001.1 NAD(P)/FAD-dependent oxidoreductase [Acidithiobacillus sp. CV18-2]MBU2799612.1 NAD(P)/FAD-dependent oxidoreductase [Acidithiobacillus sp. VAN18-4]